MKNVKLRKRDHDRTTEKYLPSKHFKTNLNAVEYRIEGQNVYSNK